MKAIISNRVIMNKTPELVGRLREELTYKFPNPNFKGKPISYCDIGFPRDDLISVPVARSNLIPKEYEVVDRRILAPATFPEFNAILRASQQEIYDDVSDNCIINAKPGFGKTFTALAVVGKLAQKTLIIVHTVKLRDQWIEEIKKVFGIKAGIIGSGKFETNPIIVVANVQTLVKRVPEVSNMFGTIVIDECHHLPSTTFKNIIDKVRARYKIGLSATLTRKDGKGILLKDYIGDKVYVPPKENTVDPVVIIRQTNIKIPGNHTQPWASRMNDVYRGANYLEEVTRMAMTQAKRGHIVLVLGERIEFLEKCDEVTPNSVVITSKTKNQKELEELVISGELPIQYASRSMYSEGVSRNEYSCLIIASAINNEQLLEQMAGRINRINENGMKPELIDIAFAGATGQKQLGTRLAFYRKEGWKIVYV